MLLLTWKAFIHKMKWSQTVFFIEIFVMWDFERIVCNCHMSKSAKCWLHYREVLCSKILKIDNAMDIAINTVNFMVWTTDSSTTYWRQVNMGCHWCFLVNWGNFTEGALWIKMWNTNITGRSFMANITENLNLLEYKSTML